MIRDLLLSIDRPESRGHFAANRRAQEEQTERLIPALCDAIRAEWPVELHSQVYTHPYLRYSQGASIGGFYLSVPAYESGEGIINCYQRRDSYTERVNPLRAALEDMGVAAIPNGPVGCPRIAALSAAVLRVAQESQESRESQESQESRESRER